MPEELEVPAGGETPPSETAPGPEVTPEETTPAPQVETVEEGTGPNVGGLISRLASGAASPNDQDEVRRLSGEVEIKALKAELETAKGADPLADIAEEYLREECRGNAELLAEHRRWIAEAPRGARDYIEAVNYQRARRAGGGGEPPEETEEQLRTRLIRAEISKQLEPERQRADRDRTTSEFVVTLDGAIQGMKLTPELAAYVRESLMADMTAWLKTPVTNFNDFLGADKTTQMADHIQKRAAKLQTLIDAVQAGKKPPAVRLPPVPGSPRQPPSPSDGKEKTIDEDAEDVIREIDAAMESGGGAS